MASKDQKRHEDDIVYSHHGNEAPNYQPIDFGWGKVREDEQKRYFGQGDSWYMEHREGENVLQPKWSTLHGNIDLSHHIPFVHQ